MSNKINYTEMINWVYHFGQGHVEGLGTLEELQSAGIEFSFLMQREEDDEEDEDEDNDNGRSTLSRIASGSMKRANSFPIKRLQSREKVK